MYVYIDLLAKSDVYICKSFFIIVLLLFFVKKTCEYCTIHFNTGVRKPYPVITTTATKLNEKKKRSKSTFWPLEVLFLFSLRSAKVFQGSVKRSHFGLVETFEFMKCSRPVQGAFSSVDIWVLKAISLAVAGACSRTCNKIIAAATLAEAWLIVQTVKRSMKENQQKVTSVWKFNQMTSIIGF